MNPKATDRRFRILIVDDEQAARYSVRRALGVHRQTLQNKLHVLGMDAAEFRVGRD